MIVADTTAWIDHFRGIKAPHTDILDYELLHSRIITGDIIITEFLQGFREDKEIIAAKNLLETWRHWNIIIFLETATRFRRRRKE